MFRTHFLLMDEANPEGGDGGGGAKTVSYESHQKLLNEKKAAADALKAANARLAELEQSDLENKGKLQEALDAQKKKTSELNEKNLALLKKVSERALKTQFNIEASKLGCIDSDLAFKACDFSDVELNDELEVDQNLMVKKVQDLAKAKVHLFKKDVKLPPNHNPTNGGGSGGGGNGQKSLDDMSFDELKAELGKVTAAEAANKNKM